MAIKAVLFDLDGTLLPMDLDQFTSGYFRFLIKKLSPLGYEPKKLVNSIWAGTAAMIRNDGTQSNEEAFWQKFVEIYGTGALRDKAVFEEFYNVDFEAARQFCGFDPAASECIETLKESGYRLILATNPIFPEKATALRIGWAGISPTDFEQITTYENIGFGKPNPEYYREVLSRSGLSPDEALMVGNDAVEDLASEKIGLHCFLLTPCLLHEAGIDLSDTPKGGFPELLEYIDCENRRH
ncbi:MAG: HAD family hydrolase [Clostridia bacterium]|nr:HAD family hydrolase [Clostridia bacterium]